MRLCPRAGYRLEDSIVQSPVELDAVKFVEVFKGSIDLMLDQKLCRKTSHYCINKPLHRQHETDGLI